MKNPLLYFNGIDEDTGDYALQPRTVSEFSELFGDGRLLPGIPKRLTFGLDPLDLAEAGWGVIWPDGVDAEVREALAPLLELRRAQATRRRTDHFRELTHLSGETALEFWRRHGLGPDSVDPSKMPYYLLIVGDPSAISFEFQYELGIPHAVGRICFDEPQDYADYARNLIDADSRPLPSSPLMAFWGVQNPGDPLTQWSVDHLVKPLEQKIADDRPEWRVRTSLRQAAEKAELTRLLAGPDPPSVLLTASHAVRCRTGTPRQLAHQGALLAADWPGREAWKKRIPDDFVFSARDVPSTLSLDGLIAFHFACYSAGTPHLDSYDRGSHPAVAAPRPFVANLPKQMLRRGALAVIGHVDIAYEHSFLWHDAHQIEAFGSTLQAIMTGQTVGHAMDHFGQRFSLLGALWTGSGRSKDPEGDKLRRARLWAAYHDARNYIILGDPAARLNVVDL